MLIKLDEHYAKYANGISEHEVEGNTIEQGMRELLNRYPQLAVNIQDNDWAVGCESSLQLNDEYVVELSKAKEQLPEGSVITLARDMPIGEDAVVQAIAGVVLAIIGFIIVIVGVILLNPAIVSGGVFLFKLGVSVIISAVVTAIVTAIMDAFFTPDLPGQMSAAMLLNSYTYTFEGAQNTTAIGTAIPVVYGSHRVGGHWLNIYTAHETETQVIDKVDTEVTSSYLYGQLGLCEGEIAGVSEVMINRLPLTYYDEVTTIPDGNYIRLGSATQDPMLDFIYTQNSVSIGRKISNATPAIPTVPVVYTDSSPVYGYLQNIAPWQDTPTYTVKRGFYSPSYGMTQQEIDEAYYNSQMYSSG